MIARIFVHGVSDYHGISGIPLGVIRQNFSNEWDWESYVSAACEYQYPTMEEAYNDLVEELIHLGYDLI